LYYKNKIENINIIIILILTIILSFIIALFIYNYLIKEINENTKKFDNIEKELNDKINEINNLNKNKILIIINNNTDICYINDRIDEYILNFQYKNVYLSHIEIVMYEYSYSYNSNIKKNKTTLILELKKELIKNKTEEFMNIMKNNLKDNLITSEIVKINLDELNKNLEDYKKLLELKINELIRLYQINEFIINFNL
jgi:hypothetical protein